MSRIKFMNIEIDNVTMQEAVKRIDELIVANRNSFVVTPNVDHVLQLQTNGELLKAYQQAALILTDGQPLIWASRLYGTPIREKVSGSDIMRPVCKLAAEKGYSMFFLGAEEGVADKAAQNLREHFSGLKIVGTYSPPYGFENDEAEIRRIIKIVRDAKPHILITAFGCPKQELFMHRYAEELNVPVSLGLGGTLNFEAGKVKRAPKWMRDHGLEWIYRTIQEPRFIGRYAFDIVHFPGLVMKYFLQAPPPPQVILLILSDARCLCSMSVKQKTVKALFIIME